MHLFKAQTFIGNALLVLINNITFCLTFRNENSSLSCYFKIFDKGHFL